MGLFIFNLLFYVVTSKNINYGFPGILQFLGLGCGWCVRRGTFPFMAPPPVSDLGDEHPRGGRCAMLDLHGLAEGKSALEPHSDLL